MAMLMRGRKLRNLPMPSVDPRIAAKQAALFPVRIQIALVLLIQVNSSIDHECKIIA